MSAFVADSQVSPAGFEHLHVVPGHQASEPTPHPLRSPGQEERLRELHRQLASGLHPEVMTELVEAYLPLARSAARRLQRSGEWLEDLQQIAVEGLIAALSRFDPDRGVPFVGYALPTMVGTIKRHYRDHGWLVRAPRFVHDLLPRARDADERLTAVLGRRPRPEEIAAELDVALETLLLAQEAASARTLGSIDAVNDGVPVADRVGTLDPALVSAENRIALGQALSELHQSDQRLVYWYFYEGRSQAEIGMDLGVSQMQVSRLLHSVVARLRDRLVAA